jgi:hypothetical protein
MAYCDVVENDIQQQWPSTTSTTIEKIGTIVAFGSPRITLKSTLQQSMLLDQPQASSVWL